MTKNYQTKTPETSALAVPEQVSVAMGEIAADMRLTSGDVTDRKPAMPSVTTSTPSESSSASQPRCG